MKKNTFLTFVLGLVVLLTSCEETFENTEAIVGKWHLVSINTKGKDLEINDDMHWEFKEDKTYSIVNTQGKFENDPFDSNPFVGKGTYTGGYHVNAPAGLVIREKYKSPYYFSGVFIANGMMRMQFVSNDEKDYTSPDRFIKLKFERVK